MVVVGSNHAYKLAFACVMQNSAIAAIRPISSLHSCSRSIFSLAKRLQDPEAVQRNVGPFGMLVVASSEFVRILVLLHPLQWRHRGGARKTPFGILGKALAAGWK